MSIRIPLRLLAAAILLALPATASNKQAAPYSSISWQPAAIKTGYPCLFSVKMRTVPSSLKGTWMGHELAFSPSRDQHTWYALAGVDLESKRNTYTLSLDATMQDGRLVHATRPVRITQGAYQSEKLWVAERFVEPDAEAQKQIATDQAVKKLAFAHQEAGPEWSGSFTAPVSSAVSEQFGTRRTFNGTLASVHRGLDYHAKPGTAVYASNSGTVVLARELYYEGNCVVVDHGQQFMTIYMHLSRIDVAEGARVNKGQQLGLSGASGRATGPHLHLAVRWQGEYLDPARLISLKLPDLQ